MATETHLLRELDACVGDLTRECIDRFEAGGMVARAEIAGLNALAEAIARSLGEWRTLTAALELAAPIDVARAGALVLESLFDEILAPEAWRVLAAALARTQASR
jgi:uncharacterized protein YjeT (DUF2065 family)